MLGSQDCEEMDYHSGGGRADFRMGGLCLVFPPLILRFQGAMLTFCRLGRGKDWGASGLKENILRM